MYRIPMTTADERIRTAHATISQRTHLRNLRAGLVVDEERAERETSELAKLLAEEQRDVERYDRGVWAFLYGVFADREARLSKEQREAVEAEARYKEATANR